MDRLQSEELQIQSVHEYLEKLDAKKLQQEAREHAYRPILENLLLNVLADFTVINDPARVGSNAPDLLIKKNDVPRGYIECKDINIPLDDEEVQKQVHRYIEAFDSIILTNYEKFWFYSNEDKYAEIDLEDRSGKNISNFISLLVDFLQITPKKIKSAMELATIMANKSRVMRDVVEGILEGSDESTIHSQYYAFREMLVHDLEKRDFADMYVQTLAYGLLVARYFDTTAADFSRHEAQDLLPYSNPLLRNFFGHVAGMDFEPRLAWVVDDLVEAYRAADVKEIMHKEFVSKSKDPILHFYETYLSKYDIGLRKKRGVYYTPQPVVSFIVRAVDDILKKDFGLQNGIADNSKIDWSFKTQEIDKRFKDRVKKYEKSIHKVQILDPAVGTGTFLDEVIKTIRHNFEGQEGQWQNYVKEDLIPRLHGFELMMASYTMAHLKLGINLAESGYTGKAKERLGIYLTNSLEPGITEIPSLFMSEWLTEESLMASTVKHDLPVMVVVGNPPYSVSSSNKGEWIQNLIKVYKQGLNEQNINSLSDDYVKFIRLAEHLIEKNSSGIVAMITNNSFIDGITHRHMRKHLLETFDDIYILDLHGNSKKKETAPDGSKDENVFDIQQGVSINIFVKKNVDKKNLGKIHHADLYGKRVNKFEILNRNSVQSIKWQELACSKSYYFFVPKDFSLEEEYNKGFKLDELFIESGSGTKFRKDSLLIKNHFFRKDVQIMLEDMNILSNESIHAKYSFNDTSDWKLNEKKKLFKPGDYENIKPVLYRPFDVRYTYYSLDTISEIIPRGDSRKGLMRHLLRTNVALITKRGIDVTGLVFVTNNLFEIRVFSNPGSQGTDYGFPLYLYYDDGTRIANFKPEIVSDIESIVGETTPEDIFDYIYAVLHSPRYSEKYSEFLKIDFPRVPYPSDKKVFQKLVSLGNELRLLHLLESPKVNSFITTYPESGSNTVEKVEFKDGNVYINENQYFGNVPDVAWGFWIGGYQPAQKWLKDRKGRTLTNEDIEHYQKIIVALTETNRIMKEIDNISI